MTWSFRAMLRWVPVRALRLYWVMTAQMMAERVVLAAKRLSRPIEQDVTRLMKYWLRIRDKH